ncbi:MAG: ribose-5-phosphate isomerase RpiA [Alphaproteobacteria bacterium]|nr:ribose-5-phosphate isomerase RpiA [Alphaproteobacteria bacterium]
MPNPTADDRKRAAALKALEFVRPGMIVGLGTGSTAAHFVQALGKKVKAGLQITGVPTSASAHALAVDAGIPLTTVDEAPQIDLTVDGADEADRQFRLIKGAGAAHLREKIVASASRRMIAIMDDSKLVEVLGRFPLSVEIVPFAHKTTMRRIAEAAVQAGCQGNFTRLRGGDAHPAVTDNGNLVADLDCEMIPDPTALATALSAIPGVVEHGLFIGICSTLIVGRGDGVEVIDAMRPSDAG